MTEPYRGMLLEQDEFRSEYLARSKSFEKKSIAIGDPTPDGWTVKPTRYKTVKHITRSKSLDRQLEDRVWMLFYNIGMDRLSSSSFAVTLKPRVDPKTGKKQDRTKQLDVVGIHEGTAFVVECKTKKELGKKSLKQVVAEMALDRNHYRKALDALITEPIARLVLVLATQNIELDPRDIDDARENGIVVWNEADLIALERLAALAGEGARYQIYNRVFQGQRIKDLSVKVPAIRSSMGGHVYYSFVMRPDDLLKIAYVHHRVGESSYLDLTNSYQRMLERGRIKSIRDFIEDGGFFPGNVILNFDKPLQVEQLLTKEKQASLNGAGKVVAITLPSEYGSAWIIDGQHRLYGYADTDEKRSETLPVIAFVNEDPSFQARVFVDINANQKKVEANLLWDLYEDLYAESDDAREIHLRAISRVAKWLNASDDSPFKGVIEVPSVGNSGVLGMRLVCHTILQLRLLHSGDGNLFHQDYDQTVEYAARRIAAFYRVIQKAMPKKWAAGEEHFVCTNAGFKILSGIMHDVVQENLAPAALADIGKYEEKVTRYLKPLIEHLDAAEQAEINRYRGTGGAEQKSREVRAELTRKMTVTSDFLERFDEDKQHEESLKARELQHYLEAQESDHLEFKGSMHLSMRKYLESGDLGANDDAVRDSLLKTIVGFLNTHGGQVVLGVLEEHRFRDVTGSRLTSPGVVYESETAA